MNLTIAQKRNILIVGSFGIGALILWLWPKESKALPEARDRDPLRMPTTTTIVTASLSQIAQNKFGDSKLWPILYDINRADRQRGQIIHPDQVTAGWIIKIPKSIADIKANLSESHLANIYSRANAHAAVWREPGHTSRMSLPDNVMKATF